MNYKYWNDWVIYIIKKVLNTYLIDDNKRIKKKKYYSVWVKIKIKLPIKKDSNGVAIIDKNKKYSKEGYIPDWEYMENFIKSFPFAEYI